MHRTEFEQLVENANVGMDDGGQGAIVGTEQNSKPRFELYHAAPSLCSHKVRSVLAERNLNYISHDMKIMAFGDIIPENYRPGYVRMRIQGGKNKKFVQGYTGQSSVTTEGFDPCVVPTLVDHEKASVVIDSENICNYIDSEASSVPVLVPHKYKDQIKAQEDIIDQAPHVAILYGANPEGDSRPQGLQGRIAGVQDNKIRVLEDIISDLDKDDQLIAAYRSKINKEAGSRSFVNDPESMCGAYSKMQEHADFLESQLQNHGGAWAIGDVYSMADIMWTVSLYRLKWLGLGHCWEEGRRPRVEEYVSRAFQRPSFVSAVIDWPNAYAPSPHIS